MKKLFITGYIRSGTSFLANFLNAQKDCVVYNNFLGNIFSLSDANLKIKTFTQALSIGQKDALIDMLLKSDKEAGVNVMRKLDKNFNNLKELYDNALNALSDNKDLMVVGNKVTRHGDKVKWLLQNTDMYVIYIYRDIRDVVLSAKKIYPGYESMALMIDIKKDYKRVEKLKSNRLLVLQFEELILNPDNEIKRLSDFLGVNIIKDLNEIIDKEKKWINNSSFNDLKKVFDSKACHRWRDYLDAEEVSMCEILSRNYIKKQRWPLSSNKYSIYERILFFIRFYLRKFKRIPYHINRMFIKFK